MEGSLTIYDGRVVYADELLDENFDENDNIVDVCFLSETLNKSPQCINLE